MRFPRRVKVVEVGPRDGLQNEAAAVATAVKIGLVDRLSRAGLPAIEAASFVSPRWVPQLADGAELLAGIRRRRGTSYAALVPNIRGFDAAAAAGVDEVAVFTAASQSFARRNVNASIEETLARFAEVAAAARRCGIRLRGYVSCALGCPYEGAVAPAAVAELAERLVDLGCEEVSLGDTTGVGTPRAAAALVDAVAARVPLRRVAVHFHDTYGQALANVLAALERGVETVDAAVGGLGGCPYAAGASGNLATEDLVYMLNGLGVETGVDLDALLAAGRYIAQHLGRAPGSKVARASEQAVGAVAWPSKRATHGMSATAPR
ncbi:MAG TPA: hydroxymethylglutaryl-CoA lyase [Anaeromyxobacteraceae bacterium]|nr:hydroxymethylglutaryl-CoA lyase [Anaeromyxobacteraceae bacterium]